MRQPARTPFEAAIAAALDAQARATPASDLAAWVEKWSHSYSHQELVATLAGGRAALDELQPEDVPTIPRADPLRGVHPTMALAMRGMFPPSTRGASLPAPDGGSNT